jgi:protein-S-isoprenylcysteine O-methyltransferase Ste14
MSDQNTSPKTCPTPNAGTAQKKGCPTQWWWQTVARRIRVPLGFVTAAVYLVAIARRAPHPPAIAWSLALVLPGLTLRAISSGTVKKNRELAVTGPYAYTRNPLYLGSASIAAGFALALASWPVAMLIAIGFALIYIPVIASEERFLRGAFPGFDAYCFFPRLTPAKVHDGPEPPPDGEESAPAPAGGFSFALYLAHREYNAALGAVLLYLSLLFMRPALEALLLRVR